MQYIEWTSSSPILGIYVDTMRPDSFWDFGAL